MNSILKDMSMDGVLIIDKPSGVTSHDVVLTVKRKLMAAKVGHLGTLDPMATGVLPLVIGRATGYAEVLKGNFKEYLATVKFGEETDTCDRDGKVVRSRPMLRMGTPTGSLAPDDVRKALKSFIGKIKQIPPMFSAVKVGGIPLYKLARKGLTVERAPREVEVYSIEVAVVELPYASFTVACSGGTYIRTLCHDAGRLLGCGAHLFSLKRTKSGSFGISDAVDPGLPAQELMRRITPVEKVFPSQPRR